MRGPRDSIPAKGGAAAAGRGSAGTNLRRLRQRGERERLCPAVGRGAVVADGADVPGVAVPRRQRAAQRSSGYEVTLPTLKLLSTTLLAVLSTRYRL